MFTFVGIVTVKNKLNPVLYFDSNSSVAKGLVKNTERILKGISIDDSSVWSLIPCYAKNQKGDLIRNGGVVKRDYIFYDEREWRYVPTKNHVGNKAVMLNLSDYESDKPVYNQSIGFHSLTFSPSDISYIILRDDREILLFKDVIRNKYANDPELVDLLLTKIITSEQIQLDF